MPSTTNRSRTGSNYRRTSNWSNFGVTGKTGGRSYSQVKNTLQCKINSYRCLFQQAQSSGHYRPTPATINRFANLVNKGANIYCVSGSMIGRWTKWPTPITSASTALRGLKRRFGTAIKAVTPTGNGNSFLVATSGTFRGKPFKFPSM